MAYGYYRSYGARYRRRYARGMAYGRRSSRSYSSSYSRRRPSSRKTTSTRRKRTRRVRESAASAPAKVTGTGHGDKYVLAQADPFDENVDGVKVPDANSQPSVPLKADDTFEFVVPVGQTASAVAFNPSFASYGVQGTASTASTWTWAASFGSAGNSGKLSQLRADFEMWRPVAHAIRITSGLAPTAAKGFLHVCVFSQALYNQTTWQYPTSVSLMQNVPGYKRVAIGRLTAEGLTVVNRPLDVTSQRYVDTDSDIFGSATTNEFHTPLQWCSVVIAVTGVDASTVPITVENILHAECIPRATAISQATAAARYNVAALAAGANANAKTSPSALDSEKPARKADAIGHAMDALGGAARGTSLRNFANFRDLGLAHTPGRGLSGWHKPSSDVVMSGGGIRNDVSSSKGMSL